jgi:hypothetical protein
MDGASDPVPVAPDFAGGDGQRVAREIVDRRPREGGDPSPYAALSASGQQASPARVGPGLRRGDGILRNAGLPPSGFPARGQKKRRAGARRPAHSIAPGRSFDRDPLDWGVDPARPGRSWNSCPRNTLPEVRARKSTREGAGALCQSCGPRHKYSCALRTKGFPPARPARRSRRGFLSGKRPPALGIPSGAPISRARRRFRGPRPRARIGTLGVRVLAPDPATSASPCFQRNH